MRALQPPFLGLTEKIFPVVSPSINYERNSAKFMLVIGVGIALIAIRELLDPHRRSIGIAYTVLGALNIAVSARRLRLMQKRVSNPTSAGLA